MPPHRKRAVRNWPSKPFYYRLPEERDSRNRGRTSFVPTAKLWQYMDLSMYEYLMRRVHGIYKSTPRKKVAKTLDELKETLATLKATPRGLLEFGDILAGGMPRSISRWLRYYGMVATNLMEAYAYIMFDDIVEYVKNEVQGDDVEDDGTSTAPADSRVVLTRTCTTSLANILRLDITDEHRNCLIETLTKQISLASDYYMDVATAVMGTIYCLKTFSTHQQAESDILKDLIPSTFLNDNVAKHMQILDHAKLDENGLIDYSNTFSSGHLQFICSANFGVRGVLSKSSEQHPIWTELQTHMLETSNAEFATNDLASCIKRNVLNKFATNMGNMWDKKRIFNNSLDKLLTTLLSLHLRPKKETMRITNIKSKAEAEAKKTIDDQPRSNETKQYTFTSRDRKRSLVRKEKTKLEKLYLKIQEDPANPNVNQWKEQVRKSEIRVQKYERTCIVSVKQKSVTERADSKVDTNNEDEDVDGLTLSKDVSCRRLATIKGILKNLLLKEEKDRISKADSTAEDKDLSEKEQQVLVLLYNGIKPYIPSTANLQYLAYQMQFILLANDIFNACRYSQHITGMVPMPSSAKLHSLTLDAPTIYALFSTSKGRYDLFKEDHTVIRDDKDATWNKPTCFGAFFSLQRINDVCSSYGLWFDHHIMVRPGCKTVSIVGKMRKPGSSKRTGMLQKRLAAKQRTTPTNLSEAEKQTYENELEELKETIKKLNAQLAKLNKRNSVYDHDKAIKQKKLSWSSSRTVELYLEIRNLKRVRFQEFREQELVRISLKSARTQAFLKRKALSQSAASKKRKRDSSTRNKASTIGTSLPSVQIPNCIDYAEYIDLNELQKEGIPLTFAGTDYGFHTLSVTSAISLEQYEFHQNLLQNKDKEDPISWSFESLKFLKFPVPYTLKNGEVNLKTLTLKYRHSMNRRKKNTVVGRAVQAAEDRLSKLPRISDAKTCFESYKSKKEERSLLRQFYWSARAVKQKRTAELFSRKAKDRIAASERAYIQDQSQCKLPFVVFCIGNAGMGIGSQIKGFNRRGGRWIQKLHGRYAIVAITNEFRTSQTCVFCYGYVIRPLNSVGKKNNGSSRCMNPKCISFMQGRAIRGRDAQASVAIAIAGTSALITKKTMEPFNPSLYT